MQQTQAIPAQPTAPLASAAMSASIAPQAQPVQIQPVDAETILLNFKEQFGRRKEVAGITRAIIEYFKTRKKAA